MAQMEEVLTASPSVAIADYPRMSWGAIIAGWLVATGIASVMYVGGLAIGFSVLDPHDTAAVAKGIGVGTCVWVVLTWVVALFLGGLFASWADGRDDPTMGTVQGVTVWGLSITASGLLLAIGMGGALGSGALLLHDGASMTSATAAAGPQAAGNPNIVNLLQAQLVQRIGQQGMQPAAAASAADQPADERVPPPWVGPRTARATTLALLGGQADTARALLNGNTRLSPGAINAVLQDLSPQVDHARNELKTAADAAAHYSAVAMWTLLAAVLLSLLAAAVGGCLGASHVHRVYHLRLYARRGS